MATLSPTPLGRGDGRPLLPHRPARLTLGLVAAVGALLLLAFLGVALGTRGIALGTVVEALFDPRAGDTDHVVRARPAPAAHGDRRRGGGRARARRRRSCRASPATRSPTRGCSASTPARRWRWCAAITWFGVARAVRLRLVRLRRGRRARPSSSTRSAPLGRDGATPVRLALVGAAFTAAGDLAHDDRAADRHRHARPLPVLARRLAGRPGPRVAGGDAAAVPRRGRGRWR